MITKERLQELIEQGATIYTSGYRESCCFKNETIVDLAKLDYFNKTKTYSIKDFGGGDFVLSTGYTCDNGCDEHLTLDELFETKEDADKGTDTLFMGSLTKENYTLACRKAKELFLGEKK